jgi:antitoxin MazE
MTSPIHSKVVKIGNSQGIRIPRSLLEQAQLNGDVLLTVEDNKLIIQSAHKPRQGWSTAFQKMVLNGDDHLLDQSIPTQWDEDEWQWG